MFLIYCLIYDFNLEKFNYLKLMEFSIFFQEKKFKKKKVFQIKLCII
jgi:hypothetical protein